MWLLCYLQHFAVVTREIQEGYEGERGGRRAFVGPKNGTRGSSRRARIPLSRGLRWMHGAGRPGRVGGYVLAGCSERLGNNAQGGTGLILRWRRGAGLGRRGGGREEIIFFTFTEKLQFQIRVSFTRYHIYKRLRGFRGALRKYSGSQRAAPSLSQPCSFFPILEFNHITPRK